MSKIPPTMTNTETANESIIDSPFDKHVVEIKVDTNSKEIIVVQNNQAVTSSLQVAETIGKRHDNVLRDIEALKKDVLNFEEMFYEAETADSYGRPRRTFCINRDGFTLLAMGFTGKSNAV